ncbi:MAG: APC family permease [Gammaproteobacteria bacterium]|nr:APC family permease [Gammaproteobacteria bacterium]
MDQLHRRFSPFHLLLISINGMIGSAWLFAPFYAAKLAGPYAIYAWIIGGLVTILIALTFAELSVFLPIAGGSSRFPQLSHGILTSFIMSWITWISALTMAPIEVQAVLQYASTYFGFLVHMSNNAPVLTPMGMLWAALIMLLLCVVNIASFKGLVRFNLILFGFKVLVIILTILFFIKTRFQIPHFYAIDTQSFSAHWHDIMTAVAAGGVAFAFTGFKHGVELAGETKNSRLAIPLAIVGSIVICLLLYIGLQIAFIGAIPHSSLAAGWNNLSFTGDVGPYAGIAAGLGLVWILKLLYIDAVVSPLGAGLIYVTSTARILYAMSKNGYFPSIFSRLNKQHFPVFAISLNFLIGMFLFLPLPGWQAMVSFLVSAMVISYAMGPISLLCLRLQLPNEKRGFRLPAAQLLCFIAFYFCNLISYWTGWETIWKFEIAIGMGLLLFVGAYLRGNISATNTGLKAILWIAPYFSGLFVISYLGSFGGKNIISFGWDFLVIALFSIVILYLAVKTRIGLVHDQYAIYKTEEFAA